MSVDPVVGTPGPFPAVDYSEYLFAIDNVDGEQIHIPPGPDGQSSSSLVLSRWVKMCRKKANIMATPLELIEPFGRLRLKGSVLLSVSSRFRPRLAQHHVHHSLCVSDAHSTCGAIVYPRPPARAHKLCAATRSVD